MIVKLFHFNPNGRGGQAFVCAETKKDAIKALKSTVKADRSDCEEFGLEEFHAHHVKKMVEEKDGYTIDELPPDEVLFSKIYR